MDLSKIFTDEIMAKIKEKFEGDIDWMGIVRIDEERYMVTYKDENKKVFAAIIGIVGADNIVLHGYPLQINH